MADVKFTPIICIGLGFSGICLGAQLKRRYGLNFADVHFYDKNEGQGGTWWANQYPGAACDIPAFLYSFSFAPNPGWTKFLATHTEIRDYIDGVVKRFQLAPHMTFCTECESASWDSERQRWTVRLTDLKTGKKYVHECKLLFSAVGQLSSPKEPKIEGMDTFEGPLFHTAQWRPEVDLEGKDIIVIGNGCSGSQLVPHIVSQTKTLKQFIHTPHWIVPFPNPTLGPVARWAFAHIPLLAQFMRVTVFLYAESFWPIFLMNAAGNWLRMIHQKNSKRYILSTAPKKFHDILIPDYDIACKRRVFDGNKLYLNSLHAPNLELVQDDIVEVLPRAVRTASKTYPADVIVFATGFETQKFLSWLKIQGRDGQWLHDRWSKMGGPSAYHTTSVHGFPNFFILYGPNSNTGHTSVLLATENTVNYTLKIIEPILEANASEVEVTADAESEYVAQVQAVSKRRVFSRCNSWYISKDGWNITMYPWSQIYFWWRSTFPKWGDWKYKYTFPVRRTGGPRTALMVVCTLSLIGGVAIGTWNRALLVRLAWEYVQTWREVLGI